MRAAVDWAAVSEQIVAGVLASDLLEPQSTVLVFLPLGDEVNLVPLMEAAPEMRYVTTRTPERGGALTVHELGGPLEVHRFGFLQPHASAMQVAPDTIDVLLLPGLVFDLWGNRLGRGAGYFDRLLRTTRRDAAKVGMVPVDLVVDRLPIEPHDVPVDWLATEEGVIATAGGVSPE